MDREKVEVIEEDILEIDKSISQIVKISSHLKIPSRSEILRETYEDLLEHFEILKAEEYSQGKQMREARPEFSFDFTIFNEIEAHPSKKIPLLKKYLDQFEEITSSDRNAILETLKDKNVEEINKYLINLVEAFKLKK